MFKTEDFNLQLKSVIKWNAVGNNFQQRFTIDDINRQGAYAEEELYEAISGISSNDKLEMIDGVADSFVTVGYKFFMITGDREFHDPNGVNSFIDVDCTPSYAKWAIVSDLSALVGLNINEPCPIEANTSASILFDVISNVQIAFGIDMAEVIAEVMESNWSKFPIYTDADDYEAECRWIEQYRKKENVAFKVVNTGDEFRVVFRDDNGAGKICKPQSFKEPNLLRFL